MAVQCKDVECNDGNTNIVDRPSTKGTLWYYNTKRILILGILVMVILITIFVIVFVNTSLPRSESVTYPIPKDANTEEEFASRSKNYSDSKVTFPSPENVKYLSRSQWLAQPPVADIIPLSLPVPYVIISHTATEDCTDQAACTLQVRFIQTFHIESRNWSDIAYNFLVGGDGNVYEGRGFKGQGAHTYGYNAKAIGIAFIGTFTQVLPPKRQIVSAQKLIEKGVEEGYVASNYKLFGSSQLQATTSPGLKLYENIKTWPHWAQTV